MRKENNNIRCEVLLPKVVHARIKAIANGRPIVRQLGIAINEWLETQGEAKSAREPQYDKEEAKTPIAQNKHDYFLNLVRETDRDLPKEIEKTLNEINNSTELTEKEKVSYKELLKNSFL